MLTVFWGASSLVISGNADRLGPHRPLPQATRLYQSSLTGLLKPDPPLPRKKHDYAADYAKLHYSDPADFRF